MPPPETMIHPETGAPLRRRKRREVVAYMDLTRVVQVTGWFPEDDGDGVLLGADAAPLDAALAEMKAEYAASVQRLAKQVRKAVLRIKAFVARQRDLLRSVSMRFYQM